MNKSKVQNVEVNNLSVSKGVSESDNLHVTVQDDIFIIVTQAFGPDGDPLVGIGDVEFDGYAAVTVGVRVGDMETLVHLSPFHGDRRKVGGDDIKKGTHCELFCPVSKKPLQYIGEVEETEGAGYYAIYLTKDLSEGEMVALSNVWGDYHSRIIDHHELISTWNSVSQEMDKLSRNG